MLWASHHYETFSLKAQLKPKSLVCMFLDNAKIKTVDTKVFGTKVLVYGLVTTKKHFP